MAPDTTPPGGATRYVETTRGLLSYSQLAPLLAEQVLRVERDIAAGTFAQRSSFPELPPVDLVPTNPAGETAYRAGLRAGDGLDWRPLMQIWQQRFEQFTDSAE